MARRTLKKQARKKAAVKKKPQQMEFPLPPPEEKMEQLNFGITASEKWNIKLHLMKLESEGEKTTMTAWLRSLAKQELERAGR